MAVTRTQHADQNGLTNEIIKLTLVEEVPFVVDTQGRDIAYVLLTNGATIAYAKFYNNADPTVASTEADMVLPAIASDTTPYIFPDNLDFFDDALTVACVQEPGPGTTAPANQVDMYIGLA